MSFLVQRNMTVQGTTTLGSLAYSNKLITTVDFTDIDVTTTTGSIIMLSRNINIIKLPFVNDTNATIPNGTCYRIYYTTNGSMTALVMQTGDSLVRFGGVVMYGGNKLNMIEYNNVLISYERTASDVVDLLYYENKWYVKGIFAINTSEPYLGYSYNLPVIGSDTINDDRVQILDITVNITDTGSANNYITGLCWTTNDGSTPSIETDSTYHINSTGTDPISFSIYGTSLTDDMDSVTLYGRVFVLNSTGVDYGDVTPFTITALCLIRGTMIQTSNGQKAIENISYDDNLSVWDFDNGTMTTAKPLWIKKMQKHHIYNKLTFSDGSVLGTVIQHRIFNKEAESFTYPMTDDTPIGTTTFALNGEITLTSKEYIHELVEYYNIITDKHMNLFANGILTSCRYNNIYPIRDMKFQKDNREIHEFDEAFGIPRKYYDGLRLSEQIIPIEQSKKYIDRLIHIERNAIRDVLFLDHQGVMYLDEWPKNGEINVFNKTPISMVKKLLHEHPSLDIVVSSDWKYRVSLPTMQLFYLSQGLKAPIDYTPKISSCRARGRAQEIQEWLNSNEIHKYVAVDDLDMRNFLDNFVWIDDINKGFDEQIYEKVAKILST